MAKRLFIGSELAGIALLLAAVGWQLFFEDVVQDIASESYLLQIDRKLDDLWLYHSFIGQRLGDRDTPATKTWGGFDQQWRRFEPLTRDVLRQADLFRGIRSLMFVLGSALVTIGRYGELRGRLSHSES